MQRHTHVSSLTLMEPMKPTNGSGAEVRREGYQMDLKPHLSS